MRYVYDSEFLEDGSTIELISIAFVAQDGREFYAVNREAPWKRIYKHEWLCENVVRHLPRFYGDARMQMSTRRNPYALDFHAKEMKTREEIAAGILEFIGDDSDVELWADYGAYDHVLLMQLYGPMVAKPAALPYFTCDLQQVLRAVTPAHPLPHEPADAHNALADAWHLMDSLHATFGTTAPVRKRWQ